MFFVPKAIPDVRLLPLIVEINKLPDGVVISVTLLQTFLEIPVHIQIFLIALKGRKNKVKNRQESIHAYFELYFRSQILLSATLFAP